MQRKLIEGIVAAAVLVLKGLKEDDNPTRKSYRHGVYDMLTALLVRPGVTEVAAHEKVKMAFDRVHRGFVHTRLAEEKIVDLLIA